MRGERLLASAKEKRSLAEKYQILNAVTAVAALVLIGGSVGIALAAIDIGQIALVEVYKRRKRKSEKLPKSKVVYQRKLVPQLAY